MTKLYKANPLAFALTWIGCYVVLASYADRLSNDIGISKVVTFPLLLGMAAALLLWVTRQGLSQAFGLCRFTGNPADYLWFLPLVLIISTNLWRGVTQNLLPLDTFFYIGSMLLVGFLEEVIFRGLLFTAICESSVKQAFVITSLTFGIGHIVNLLNGAALLPTLLQIISASAIGFLFALIFYRGKSLWPCILTHGLYNSLSAFSVAPTPAGRIFTALATSLIALGYARWLCKTASR